MNRYQRQSQLPEIGEEGQLRLAKASVLIVGAGGLGCPVLSYLVGAGVGRLIIVDHDTVDESNLHRQPLYKIQDIGKSKAQAARAALLAYNPHIEMTALSERLTPANAARFVGAADIVVDAADSFAVTYILSDACASVKKNLVSASVLGFSGYVGLFCGHGPSYRAVFPDMPMQAANCAEAGVLGTAVAVLGSLQAHLTLSTLLDLAPPKYQLISFDGRNMSFSSFDYSHAQEPLQILPFVSFANINANDIVIDVRGLEEAPQSPYPTALRVLPDEIETILPQLDSSKRTILCCRSGIRAAKAANRLKARGVKNLALIAFGDIQSTSAP